MLANVISRCSEGIVILVLIRELFFGQPWCALPEGEVMGQARKADRLLDQLAARVLDPHSAAPDDSVALAIAKLAIENSAKGNVGVKEGLIRRWNAQFIFEVVRDLIPSSPTSKGGG